MFLSFLTRRRGERSAPRARAETRAGESRWFGSGARRPLGDGSYGNARHRSLLAVSTGRLKSVPGHYSTSRQKREYVLSNNPQGASCSPGPRVPSAKNRAMECWRIGFFTEIYRPVVNGVVASIEALADGLRAAGTRSIVSRRACRDTRRPTAPSFACRRCRLPTHAVPVDAAAREPAQSQRRDQAALDRSRALAVRHRLDGPALRAPLRHAAGLHVSHAARRVRALRALRTERDAICGGAVDAHVRELAPMPSSFRRRAMADASARRRRDAFASKWSRAASTSKHFGAGRRDEAVRRNAGATPGDRLVLYVGRLAKEKNVELLIEALARTPDASLKLAIAGDGPLRARARSAGRRARALATDRFLGVVARARSAGALRERRRVRHAEHDRDARPRHGRSARRRLRTSLRPTRRRTRRARRRGALVVGHGRGLRRGP